ncbi:MAG TPA: hypothetical protein VH247_08745 [Thermoleophilaceae bacterium]|jgi:hypothetical protein|nr:hypothetical protein [Thermoleophilaceae bacterium]
MRGGIAAAVACLTVDCSASPVAGVKTQLPKPRVTVKAWRAIAWKRTYRHGSASVRVVR